MGGKEGGEVLGHSDRTDAGSATAVGDAEGLVEVEVAGIGAEIARPADADESVEVGAIQIDLAASVVDLFTEVADAGLEDAMGGGVGDHGGGKAWAMFLDFGVEVGEIDVAGRITGDGDDAEAGKDGAGGIGAVGGDGDQTDIALGFAAGVLPGANGEETGVFALGAGVGLEGDVGQAGDFAKPVLEVGNHASVAGVLIGWGKRMGIRDGGPTERGELRRGVQLHGA
jgi:hypothetical protein